jgi:hypothetical protein
MDWSGFSTLIYGLADSLGYRNKINKKRQGIMIELIWGILNGFLLIYFIIVCFKSVKLIKEKIGVLASLIFVIGLLSFISKSDEKKITNKNIEILNQTNPRKAFSGNSYSTFVTLEDNLTSKIELRILYGEKESDKELTILDVDCYRTGFTSGNNWNAVNIDVDKENSKIFCTYNVSGILDWKILGITIFSEVKNFKGNALLKK